jgi:hypothetical protein
VQGNYTEPIVAALLQQRRFQRKPKPCSRNLL